MDVGTLQRLTARTWPGLEQHRLGEWELRAAGGFTGRANSALPIGDPGVELPEAMDQVGAWYAARGLAPRLQVPDLLADQQGRHPDAEVDAWCDAQGWAAEPWTLVLTRPAAGPPRESSLDLHWADVPDGRWLDRYHHRGSELPASALRVITAAPAHYLTATRAGEVIGIGRAAVVEDLVVLTAIEVAGEHRRRGYGAAITEALAAAGAARGATMAALQVFAHNRAAVGLYRNLGYRDHHRYRYRSPSVR